MIFSNLFTPVHLYYRPQIKRIHVFKRIFRSDISRENQSATNLERFRKILSSHVLMSSFSLCLNRTNPEAKSENKNLHPRVRVDQAVRPLPPKTLSILVGLILKLTSMCITIYKFRKVWTV